MNSSIDIKNEPAATSNIKIDITKFSKGTPPFTNQLVQEGSENPTLTTHHAYLHCSLKHALGNRSLVIGVKMVKYI